MIFLPKSEFWKSVFTLSLGTGISQLIPILISPLLSRIYSPLEFGIFGLYFSITMILSVFICGRYEMAILLPNNEIDRYNLFILCLTIASIVFVLLFILMFCFSSDIATLLNNKNIENKLILIPISVFFIGTLQSLNYWGNRNQEYVHLSISRITKSISNSLASLLIGLSALKHFGLIIGDLIGNLISNIYLFKFFYAKTKSYPKKVNFNSLKIVAKRYNQFPKYYIVSGLFEKAASNAPLLLFSIYFSPLEAGYFTLALKLISAPVTLIANSIGDVFKQEASEMFSTYGNCYPIFYSTFKKLITISIPLFIIGFLIIKFGFVYIFGKNWDIAGNYCQILLIMFFLQFTLSPLTSMFIIAEKQKTDMIKNIFVFIMCIFVFWISKIYFKSAYVAILFYAILHSFKYIFEFILSKKYSLGNV